jgi:hypothetical protein
MARELVIFRFKVGQDRSDDVLDWREGPDDDLVWRSRSPYGRQRGGRAWVFRTGTAAAKPQETEA